MAEWYPGTIGFGYRDWQDIVYPTGCLARDYLAYYSRIFNAVEMDTTFYGIPRRSTVERWAASVPQGFKFCAKTPRKITHELGLIGAASLMKEFCDSLRPLEDKLGAILIQLPPSFDASHRNDLARFLEELPGTASGTLVAVEFRHRSWYLAEIAGLLRSHGICWAATEFPRLPRQINLTADFLYVRWIGQHGSYDRHTHERVDKTSELTWWWEQLHALEERVPTVYGFFNNDYAGFAAGTCNKFKRIAGLPVVSFPAPEQGRLF